MRHPLFIACLFLLICCHSAIGQIGSGKIHVVIDQRDEDHPIRIKQPRGGVDSTNLNTYLAALRYDIIKDGFLAASFDTVIRSGDTAVAQLVAGRRYKWANLTRGNVREEMLGKAGYRQKFFKGTPFNPVQTARLIESLLDQAENEGFPFAQVKFDKIAFKDDSISAVLDMTLNNYTVIDSIIIKGGLAANRKVIENHLGLEKNAPYNQQKLNRIPVRLRELPYVKVIKPFELGMRDGKADVYLYLDNKKASNFDGVIGVLPDPVTGDIVFTGDVTLDLMNSLRRGETINLRWQRLQTRTQQLDLRFEYPFLFNTPLGIELKANLFRQDTLFSQVNLNAALQYYFQGGKQIKIFVEDAQANVISPSAYQQGRFVDSRTTMFGLGTAINTLDYRFNPRSGYFIEAQAAAGTKRIQENPEVDESFYDDINTNSEIYNVNILAGLHIPIGRQSTLLLRVRGGYFLNENMFQNEAYRIGGLKSIRGFNEQTIFATGYTIGTMEFRYLLEANSNVFLFVDQGVYENRINQDLEQDTPIGFGGGINFETGAGIFSLTYALGRQFDNNIELRGGKIHFGFVSFF